MLLDRIKSMLGVGSHSAGAAATGDGPPGAGGATSASREGAVDPVHLAACVLLLDVAYADGTFTDDERSHLEETMGRHFALPSESVRALIDAAEGERANAIDHFRYTNILQQHFDIGQKMVLAEVMWGLVLADGTVDEHEHYLTRKISNLLELEPGFLSTAKQRAAGRGRGGE